MPRPWSEWAAAPAATARAKLRAATVARVAPHTHGCGPISLHGPMAQFLQQIPSAPTGQGIISAARSKAVSITPSQWRASRMPPRQGS